MPIDGNGIYSVPVGTEGVAGQPIESAKYNAFLADMTAGMNAVRPVTLGGTGTSSVPGIRTLLGIPTTTVDNTIPRFNSTAGAMQTSTAIIDDDGRIALANTEGGGGSGYGGRLISLTNFAPGIYLQDNSSSAYNCLLSVDGDQFRVFGTPNSNGTGFTTAIKVGLNTGSLLVGDNSYDGTDATDPGVNIQGHSATNPGSISATTSGFATVFLNRQGSNGNIMELFRSASYVGGMSVTTTATTFLTSSDKRLKSNPRVFDSGEIIDALDAWQFDWRSGGTGYGVFAQDAYEVFPDAVSFDEEKDHWSVDYSKFMPVVLREMKELRRRLKDAGL